LREPRVGFATIAPSGDSIDVTVADAVDREQARGRLRELSHQSAADRVDAEQFTIADADGGILRLTPTAAAIADATNHADDETVEVLSRRLEGLQIRAKVHREADAVVIDLPRQSNTERLKATLVAPGKLSIRLVDMSVGVDAAVRGQTPPQSEVLPGPDKVPYLVQKRVAVSGDALIDAQAELDAATKQPVISFRLNAAGTRQFARVTTESVGVPMAIVLDGVVLTAPVIREPIVGGNVEISNGLTVEKASNLAAMLRSGALPAPLTIVAERDIGR
jgi:protein-export membrane protein SecD